MLDFIIVALGLGLFVLSVRYVILCPTRSSGLRNSKSRQSSKKGATTMIPQWLDFRSRSTASSSRQISEVVLPRKMSACDAEADSSRVAAGGVYGHLRLFGAPGRPQATSARGVCASLRCVAGAERA